MLWLDSLGLPAVLPPREEEKDFKTTIGAARAKQSARACSRRSVPRSPARTLNLSYRSALWCRSPTPVPSPPREERQGEGLRNRAIA